MERMIGGILILTATCGAGYVYCRELNNYIAGLRYLRYTFSLIRGEINYAHAPLPEVLSEVAGRVRQPYRKWLLETARALADRSESSFARIWNKCVDRYLDRLDLKEAHSVLLKEAGTFLGSLEKDTLDHTLQMYLNRMDLEIEKQREGLASRIRIGRWLGVMSGLFLIVLLL